MRQFRVHVESDEEGSSWWCEDDHGYIAVADILPQLESLIHEWVEFEGMAEFTMVMPDVQAEVAGL